MAKAVRAGGWKPEVKAQAIALAGEGLSRAEIADRLGVTRNAVVGLLFREGLTRPTAERDPCARFSDAQLLTVWRLTDRGATRYRIGKAIGATDGTVRAVQARLARDLEASEA